MPSGTVKFNLQYSSLSAGAAAAGPASSSPNHRHTSDLPSDRAWVGTPTAASPPSLLAGPSPDPTDHPPREVATDPTDPYRVPTAHSFADAGGPDAGRADAPARGSTEPHALQHPTLAARPRAHATSNPTSLPSAQHHNATQRNATQLEPRRPLCVCVFCAQRATSSCAALAPPPPPAATSSRPARNASGNQTGLRCADPLHPPDPLHPRPLASLHLGHCPPAFAPVCVLFPLCVFLCVSFRVSVCVQLHDGLLGVFSAVQRLPLAPPLPRVLMCCITRSPDDLMT